MPYHGHVENGVIVLDDDVDLKDGTTVTIEVTAGAGSRSSAPLAQSRFERYRDLIGALDDMPHDWSSEHDRYLRESHES